MATQKQQTHDARREEILQAVRDECAEVGVSRLSVSSVTKRVGMTRSLFYHYFPTKEDAIDAAIDASIDTFVARLEVWNSQRVPGDVGGALLSISELLCHLVLNESELPKLLVGSDDPALYTGFLHSVSDRCARYICNTTVVDFAAAHTVEIDHVYETFYMLTSGLIMFIRTHPETSPTTIRDIAAATLHLEQYVDDAAAGHVGAGHVATE